MKKTDIVIIATQSNNEPIAVWVKALIKSKLKIELLVKRTAKALQHDEILSADFNGQWITVAGAIGGLIVGNWIDNKRDAARIAR